MDWLLFATLGMIWATFLLPGSGKRSGDPLEKKLEMLTHMQNQVQRPGRWVLMPRQDERFIGTRGRAMSRTRHRRRQVLSVLGEAIAFSGLIGAFPPLRSMWIVTAILAGFFVLYLGMLLRLRLSTPRKRVVELPSDEVAVMRRRASRAALPTRRAASS